MGYIVNFKLVEHVGLESSPIVDALAGLRANEARYFWNKYKQPFEVFHPNEKPEVVELIRKALALKNIEIKSPILNVAQLQVEGILWSFAFYESGLSINVLYSLDEEGKRAVGIKLSDGMEIPEELVDKFKFARQKSKLAGTIRGSYFVIKEPLM